MDTNRHECTDRHFANDREWISLNLNSCKFGEFISVFCFHLASACICVLFFCSCATENSHREIPAAVSMSKDAGRKKMVLVGVRLENGEKLQMILDTGAAWTCFDKSMEPKLGKRLDTTTLWNFGKGADSGIYQA